MKQKLSRREFLELAAMAGVSVGLSACAPKIAATATEAAAAGAAPAASGSALELVFMHYTQKDSSEAPFFYPALDDFAAANPNVKVSQDLMSHDEFLTKFKTLAAANELTDVFEINGDQITALGTGGLLSDLSADLAADPAWRDLQAPGMMWEWTRGDKVYAMPRAKMVTHLIYYNSAIAKEIGFDKFPETWEGFMDMIAKAKAAGYVPINVGNKGKWPTFDCMFGCLAIRMAGMDWYTKLLAHEEKFTNPDFVKALSIFQEMVNLGAFNEDANSLDMDQAMSYYYNKKSLMFIQGSWATSWVDDKAPADVRDATKIAVYPTITGGKGKANESTSGSGWGWAISSKLEGDERKAAVALLKSLSNEVTGRRAIESGQLPAQIIKEYDDSKMGPTSKAMMAYTATLGSVPIINMPLPPSVIDIYANGLADMIAKQGDPTKIAEACQKEYENYK